MQIDYRLSEDWDENSIDLAAADETDLRYCAATGDIILRNDQTDLSAKWGWIPLIDFALALREIGEVLAVTEGTETFEFTESDATLQFNRRGEQMIIRGSYRAGEINAPFSAFEEQVRDFARRLDMELLAKRPELKSNPVYQDLKLSGLSP
ncbi:MAG: hypothetical protein JO279_06430 [Verrucomicrobia bacterium]|nr:hypothetical protein [Verrucomicrobiota bacterium]MBV8376625.1 hypothetical protein [Verrucomicrobiota bacterium]